MEYDQDTDNNEGGIMQRIKESPRTVSALIIILIVAAAIYAFSGDETQQTAQIDEGITLEEGADLNTEEDEGLTDSDEEAVEETEESADEGEAVATPKPVSRDSIAAQNEALPQATKTDTGYVEVAAAGEGMTHLARHATTRYLNENNVEYAVTNEHRIYIEDYIQDRLGTQSLAIGENMAISYDLIQEAVAAAGNLSAQELNNLTQYTYVLS